MTSAILFRGFKKTTPIAGLCILLGFFVIVGGVSLLFAYSLKDMSTSGNGSLISKRPKTVGEPVDMSSENIELQSRSMKSNRISDFEAVPNSDDDDDDQSIVPRASVGHSEERYDSSKTLSAANHLVVDMKQVNTSSSSGARINVIPPFPFKKTTERVMNPNKIRHSPTPSFDHPITFATSGIATGSLIVAAVGGTVRRDSDNDEVTQRY